MDNITSFGTVIREIQQGENDKLLTILTPKYGKVFALARGVRKITNKNAVGCQLFAYSEFDITNTRGRNVVKTAVINDLFFEMRQDPERFALVSYFAEILNFVVTENNDETETFRLFLNSVYALSYFKKIPVWLVKGAFELKLMCILGFMPDFKTCFCCGNDILIREAYTFSFEDASLVCDNCKNLLKKLNNGFVPNSCTISHGLIRYLAYICTCDLKKLFGLMPDFTLASEFSFVCENYLIYKTERTYETLKIFKSISNSLYANIQEKNEK